MRYTGLRTAANVVLYGGWVVPVVLARLVPARMGPAAGDATRLLNVVAGAWLFCAVVYGVVVALRMRRGMSG